jgi:hypothetical protein
MRKIVMISLALALAAGAARGADDIRCESANGQYRECPVGETGRVVLSRQLSDTACVEGRNWGVKNGMVWVSGGCRGDFAVTDVPAGTEILCESINNIRHTCRADVRGGVMIVKRVSGNACIRDASWGTNDEGIWVDKGCRARFVVANDVSTTQSPWARTVTCESNNNGQTRCPADTSFGVLLTSRISKNACDLGTDWGWDQSGIWVNNGCRAEFSVGGYRSASLSPMTSSARPTLLCESKSGTRSFCRAETAAGVSLLRQVSESTCEQGKSWGYNEQGIWVDKGCRAEFALGR